MVYLSGTRPIPSPPNKAAYYYGIELLGELQRLCDLFSSTYLSVRLFKCSTGYLHSKNLPFSALFLKGFCYESQNL